MQRGGINLRKTHPLLYRLIMGACVGNLLLALNYWFARPPTFNPYSIPKNLVGAVFCVLGVGLLLTLNVWHRLSAVRLVLAASMSFTVFWGVSNTQQGLDGLASFALPILLAWVAFTEFVSLIEAPVNPMTERK